jgi:hypothetical protein
MLTCTSSPASSQLEVEGSRPLHVRSWNCTDCTLGDRREYGEGCPPGFLAYSVEGNMAFFNVGGYPPRNTG